MNEHQGMKKSSEELFQEGLEIVLHGQSTKEFLEQHPESATELRSLLGLASQVRDAVVAEPRPEAKAAALEHVLASAQAQPSSPYLWLMGLISFPRAFSAAAALLLLLVLTSVGALVASASALPGEPLYPVKTGLEHIQLAIALNEEAKVQTYAELAARRTNEIAELNRQGKPVPPETVTALSQQTSAAVAGMEAVVGKQEASNSETLGQTLVDLTNRQQDVLSAVAANAPDAAKPALQKALEVSQTGKERAREVVEKARERKVEREEEREKQKGTATAQPGDRESGRGGTGRLTPTSTPTATPRGDERGRTATPGPTSSESPGVTPPHEENQPRGRERAEEGAPPTISPSDDSTRQRRLEEEERGKDREGREQERDKRRGEHRDRDNDSEHEENLRVDWVIYMLHLKDALNREQR